MTVSSESPILTQEVGVYLKCSGEPPAGLQVRELPSCQAASVVHHGAFNRIGEAYVGLLQWIDASGYRVAGPVREIFLHINTPVSREDESNVTEIQVPVDKG
jgi:effector-binding domain-containing protein